MSREDVGRAASTGAPTTRRRRGANLSLARDPLESPGRPEGRAGVRIRPKRRRGTRVAAPVSAMTPPAPDDSPILLVDDDPEMRAMLRDVLAGAGFRVEEAADTDALVALVPRVGPAVVILDHEMPGDWGLEFLPTLRRRWPEIPVVVITAFGGPKLRETAERLGACAYLDKPFRVAELLAAVRQAFSLRPLAATSAIGPGA